MILKFGDDTTTATMGAILAGLDGWTLNIEYQPGVSGFPSPCAIEGTNDDSVVICDVTETGAPIPNSLYHVGYDEIKSITIV